GQGRKPSAVIRPLGKNLRPVLYQRLTASGVLRAEPGRALGIFPTRTWPAQDPSHEAETRQLVTQALTQPTAPDERTAALIALLHALKCEHKIVDLRLYQLSRRQLRARAAEIAQGNWASAAVRKAIEEMIAAVAAASAAAATATSGQPRARDAGRRPGAHRGACRPGVRELRRDRLGSRVLRPGADRGPGLRADGRGLGGRDRVVRHRRRLRRRPQRTGHRPLDGRARDPAAAHHQDVQPDAGRRGPRAEAAEALRHPVTPAERAEIEAAGARLAGHRAP